MRALLLPCLILFAAAPADAELQDVRARVSGQEGRVWLAFDTQPTTLETIPGETGVDLVIGGVSVASLQLSPANRELVTALAVEPGAGGAQIHLEGAQVWQSVSAELRSGGVLVTVSLSSPAATSPSHMASRYPPLDPNWTPTPVPGAALASADSAHPDAPYIETPSTDASGVANARTPAAASAVPVASNAGPAAEIAAPAAETAAQPSTAARASALPAQAASMAAAALPDGTGRCQAAAADFEANPWNDTSLMIHAGCLSAAGDITTAAILYQQMLAFEPDNVDAALGLADIRVQQGDTAAARALYDVAARHATSDAQAAYARNQAAALQQH